VDTGQHPHWPGFSQAERSRGPNITAAAPVRDISADISLFERSWDYSNSSGQDIIDAEEVTDEDTDEKGKTTCLPFKKRHGQEAGASLIKFLKSLMPAQITSPSPPPAPNPQPPDTFRWIIRSVHLHPSALVKSNKAMPSSWWIDFRIYLRSDLTIRDALSRHIPWEHHMRPAEEMMLQVHDEHPSRFDTLEGQFWRRDLSFWDTPQGRGAKPVWKVGLMFFHKRRSWLEEQDPVGFVIKETAQA
jgi:hypothetical protein